MFFQTPSAHRAGRHNDARGVESLEVAPPGKYVVLERNDVLLSKASRRVSRSRSRVRLPRRFLPREGEGRRNLIAHTVAAVGRGTRVPDSDKARPRKEGLGVEEGGVGICIHAMGSTEKGKAAKKHRLHRWAVCPRPWVSMARAIYKTRCDALHAAKRCI